MTTNATNMTMAGSLAGVRRGQPSRGTRLVLAALATGIALTAAVAAVGVARPKPQAQPAGAPARDAWYLETVPGAQPAGAPARDAWYLETAPQAQPGLVAPRVAPGADTDDAARPRSSRPIRR